MTSKDKREERRIPLQLKVAVVYHQHEDEGSRPTYHGITSDVSLGGVSVVVNHNIFNEDDVTVLLAIPPEHPGGRQKIAEATAKMAYTVYSSEHQAFRIGLSFKSFKGNGKHSLKEAIERRAVKYNF